MNRRITQYKINNVVILEETKDLFIESIERMKGYIAEAHGCTTDDVEVVTIDTDIEISEIDVTSEGMFNWLDTDYIIYSGVKLNLIEGSDEHLDAINNGMLINYLEFN